LEEQAADWGLESWLDEEPDTDPSDDDIDMIYLRPLSEKEQVCERCNIPRPCWC
jgi:hypothetical protein